MSRRTGQSLRIAAIALFGGGLAPTGWAQVLYRVTPLADVPGGVGLCQAEDLNDAGQITGTVRTATSVLAVVWDTPTLVRPLPPAAGQLGQSSRSIPVHTTGRNIHAGAIAQWRPVQCGILVE
jgi:hypothetical protein